MRTYVVPDSAQIKTINYSPVSMVLTVGFLSGHVYRYSEVPPEVVANVMFAPSVGSSFDSLIKKGNYPYVKLT